MSNETIKKTKNGLVRILAKIGVVLSWILLVLAIVIFGSVTYDKMTGSQPSLFGYSFYVVLTDSMTPEIQPDDMVFTKKVEVSELKVGDDIVFYSVDPDYSDMRRVHRIEKIENGVVYTRGIKEGAPSDGATKQILGKVIGKSTIVGNICATFVRNPMLIYPLLLGVITVFIVFQVINIVKLGREMASENAETETETEIARFEAKRDANQNFPSLEHLGEPMDFPLPTNAPEGSETDGKEL